jgi:alpha-glucosidase
MKILKRLRFFYLAPLLALLGSGCTSPQQITIKSPNKNISVTVGQENGVPCYKLILANDTLIQNSNLGLQFTHLDASKNFKLESITTSKTDTLWETVWGEDQFIQEKSNNIKLNFQQTESPNLKLQIEFRIFNDGIGFRYNFPEQQGIDSLLLINEKTQFNLASDNKAWWFPVDYDSYEKPYQSNLISEIDSVQTPFTMISPKGVYMSIHEAALVDYASMTLKRNPQQALSMACNLVPWPDGIKVRANKSMKTPWRSIQIGKEAKDLINSRLILNLNEPCKLENTSWIKPMKYMGIWWGMHLGQQTWFAGPKHGATTKNTLDLIDFAAEHHFDGILVEGWNLDWKKFGEWDFKKPYPDFDMDKIAKYCQEKKVALIGHHETSGNVELYESQLDSALNYYHHYGISAIKTGYVGPIKNGQYHHGQWMVNHYQKVVEQAAGRNISIVAHEPIKPTGLRRTYPNFLSREGALGQEFNAPWSSVNNTPAHTTILPFTRMLAGPMDFTPGIFSLTYEKYGIKDKRVNTTLAKQLALYVVIYSPVQMAADLQENYINHPAFEFIKSVAVDWKQSIALNGEIGQYVTMARKERKGERWFLGSITNEKERDLSVSLNFLDPNKKYLAKIYADAAQSDWKNNPYPYTITEKEVDAQSILKIHLAAGGGQAIELIPIEE